MLRTFTEHVVRPVDTLDGQWEFVTAADRKDKHRLPNRYNRTIHVPSAWESLPRLAAYRGKAWFRRTFPATDDLAVRIVFGGVSHTADVYVDGKKAGHHYDAFTPWHVVVPNLSAGEHELVVSVDNTFGPHSALHLENDYYTYGGITRPAELHYVENVYIERMHLTPRRQGDRWALDVRVRLANWSDRPARRRLVVHLDESLLDLGTVTVRPKATREVSGSLPGLNVRPWTSERPNLYEVEALLIDPEEDSIVDDLIDRVGFRQIAVRGRKILLNGEPVRLRGHNRHEDHPQFGCAMPVEAMVHDLEIMRDLGCNFIRTCHYPNDRRFLDLCDEMGFYVWEESHARTVDFKHPKFREQIETSTREMIDSHRNHPSIVIWGCLNECESHTPFGRREYARVLGLIKKLDPTRPVTFASNHADEDLCLDTVDIVSWNRYDGWYHGELADVEPMLKKMLRWLHSKRSRGGSGKPVILSEFGAGAIYGHRSPNRAKWTEEYQCDVLDETLRVYLNHPNVAGVAIWQFCDVRITRGWWRARPRTMNNKGTVDEYRRPKLAYDVVKRRMHAARRQWG